MATIKTKNLRVYILEDSELWGMIGPRDVPRFPIELYGDRISCGSKIFINMPESNSPTLVVDNEMVSILKFENFINMISKACDIKFPNERVGITMYYANAAGLTAVNMPKSFDWSLYKNIFYQESHGLNDPWIETDKLFFQACAEYANEEDEEYYDEYENEDDDEEEYPPFDHIPMYGDRPLHQGPLNMAIDKVAQDVRIPDAYRKFVHDAMGIDLEDEEDDEIDELARIINGKKKKSSKSKKSYSTLASFKHGDHVKKDVTRHGIMITEKKYYQRDKKIIKDILKDLIPGDSKWISEYRKAVLHRWMDCLVITDKEAKERRKAYKKAKRVRSVNHKADVINGVTKTIMKRYNATNNPFYDPTK